MTESAARRRYTYVELDPQVSLSAWRGSLASDVDAAFEMWSAGFHPKDADQWFDLAKDAYGVAQSGEAGPVGIAQLAAVWRATGLDVAAVRDWLEQDVMFADPMREPMSALVWTEAGFTPQEAASWHGRDRFHASFTPDLAAEFADGGWSPAEASLLFALASRLADVEDIVEWAERWIRTNLDPGDVLDFAWAGVNPTEGSTLARWNNKQHLDEELRAREEHLQNLAIGGVRGAPRALRRVAAQQVRRPRS